MRSGILICALILSAGRPAQACGCNDGSLSTLGCCGEAGQRICDDVFSSCDACLDGYHYDELTFACQPPCPTHDDGSCFCPGKLCGPCGQAGDRICLDTHYAWGCAAGTCQDRDGSIPIRCETCESRDDGQYFTLGPCGKGNQRECALIPGCDHGYSLDNGYLSYIGTAECEPNWPGSPAVSPLVFDYTFVVATDMHVGTPQRSNCYPESAYKVATARINTVGNQLWPEGFDKAGLAIGAPIAVVSTGDMTVHGTGSPEVSLISEMTRFRDYWDENRGSHSIDFPVYEGLGNHDVAEDDCLSKSSPLDIETCSERKLSKNNISHGYLKLRMKNAIGVHYDDDTSNYSWDWGSVHFIQGNLSAGHSDNHAWLIDDLATYVGTSGRPVVLFQHYGWDTGDYSDGERRALQSVLAGYNVIGLFAGHTHSANFIPGRICSTFGNPCRDAADCSSGETCGVNSSSPGFDQFTGDTGGKMQNCDSDTDPVVGEGSFFVVRMAQAFEGTLKMEVLRMHWSEGYLHYDVDPTIDGHFSGYAGHAAYSREAFTHPTPPIAVCANRVVIADGACRGFASVDGGSYSPDGAAVTCVPGADIAYPLGTRPVALTCSAPGGFDACVGSVEVVDKTPPKIECPPPQRIECTGRSGASAGYAPKSADNCGAPVIDCQPKSGSTFPLGIHSLTCTASDAVHNTAKCSSSVEVVDTTSPQVTCPAPLTLECSGDRQAAGGVLAVAKDLCDPGVEAVCSSGPGALFPLGTTAVQCGAADASGNPASCSTQVTVVDTLPPVLASLSASAATLWPPDSRLVEVALSPVVSDLCDPIVDCHVTGVTSNETAGDWRISAPLSVQLRAQRNGNGHGRVYNLTVECRDSSGNASRATTTVTVPHDQR